MEMGKMRGDLRSLLSQPNDYRIAKSYKEESVRHALTFNRGLARKLSN